MFVCVNVCAYVYTGRECSSHIISVKEIHTSSRLLGSPTWMIRSYIQNLLISLHFIIALLYIYIYIHDRLLLYNIGYKNTSFIDFFMLSRELIEGDREYKRLRREWAESKQRKREEELEKQAAEKTESARDILERLSISLQGDRKSSVQGERHSLTQEDRKTSVHGESQAGDTT